jgi:hypothetical protein
LGNEVITSCVNNVILLWKRIENYLVSIHPKKSLTTVSTPAAMYE